jgi:mannose-1-phosphate guanylyltransferase/phosphomannomutase
VFCPADSKGAVMRAVSEAAEGLKPDLTEGVRVCYEGGWALVLPDSAEPTVNVWAEAPTTEAAWDRVSEWQHIVESAIAGR